MTRCGAAFGNPGFRPPIKPSQRVSQLRSAPHSCSIRSCGRNFPLPHWECSASSVTRSAGQHRRSSCCPRRTTPNSPPGQRATGAGIAAHIIGTSRCSRVRIRPLRDAANDIDPADQARTFERFRRGVNSPRTEGPGLTLTIGSAIAMAPGSSVDVFSRSGLGSKFFVDIPLIPEGSDHQPHPAQRRGGAHQLLHLQGPQIRRFRPRRRADRRRGRLPRQER